MDDNARPHLAVIVEEYLKGLGLERMEWPARSPDLKSDRAALELSCVNCADELHISRATNRYSEFRDEKNVLSCHLTDNQTFSQEDTKFLELYCP
ncbi:hypothetical protein TNCV_2449831 [Trichonephila clavipes]|uniref:Uncharacterized protein n=1 Tax=Trichonephila clavipes TaxID=2585209 RepID=A0A8X6UWA7_TRICX|nr:hypothetical protein TNCV_2449831 [Trichonephila clavipes]